MTKNILGFMLIDAPHSALNNAGSDAGERTENIVRVKSIRKGRDVYPYVSGQALRFWWRSTLRDNFGWDLSPIVREKKVAFTASNPIEYEDDDLFGYMRALKKSKGGTVTRASVLKNSPLVSVLAQSPTADFGVMARQQGDPVPYEHEFYSTVLKGMFSLDLDQAGIFYNDDRSGYKNMYPDLEEIAEKEGLDKKDDKWILDKSERTKRVQDVINALPYLSGGAMQTSHLTDVSPNFIVLCILDSGNHIFMNLVKEDEDSTEVVLNLDVINQVLKDYNSNILTDIYIGRNEGFLDNYDEELSNLSENGLDGFDKDIQYGSVKETIEAFADLVPEYVT